MTDRVVGNPGAETLPCGRRYTAVGWLAALAAALVLYGFTMAPDLVWHDAGYYQWEAGRLNLVRPGEAVRVHPFFVVLAHGLGQLGIWNYAKAASVASTLGTAVTVANVWLIVWLLARRLAPASVAALACMVAHTIWQQGVQPQTYGWSNAALSGMIACAVAYAQGGRARWLMPMFFAGGVGMSIHLMSQLGLAVLGVWVLVRALRRRTPAWVLPAGVALWVIGAALFWYVVYLEYERTQDVAATAQSALVGGWGSAIFNLQGIPRMLLRSLLMLVLNFPTPVALLGLYGLWRSPRLLKGTPAALLLVVLLIVYAAFGARYRVANQNFFFTPVYMLAAVYIGLGLHAIGWAARRLAVAAIVILTLAVIPAYWLMAAEARARGINPRESGPIHQMPYRDFYAYYLMPWQQNQTGPRRFAEEVFEQLPPGAVLLPDSTTSPPLKCMHDIEGVRPDVLIVDPYDAGFEPAYRQWWQGDADLLPEFAANGRRVFVTSDYASYIPRWVAARTRLDPAGKIWEVLPRGKEGPP
jgi:hypothetical protein